MKIVTFAAIKGGVGKTTLTYNYGEWLADQGYKVLFIDLDHQCNLTQTYDIFENEETVASIFTRAGNVNIHQVAPNIDLIAGFIRLDTIEKELETKNYKDMLLYMWLRDNYESKDLGQYDYILIDCHPDFSTATKNAVIVSHVVLSPITPSKFGYDAKSNLSNRIDKLREETFDFRTRESYVTAKLYLIANMIKHNTNSSKQMVKALEVEDNVLAFIPYKELFNRSTLDTISLATMKKNKATYQEHREFFDNLDVTFQKISDTISI
ncbi:ParA family protein [Streptococcus ovis]|uniref:ParA family protein n=1 Tax=Streptococcus ovis TaxID=82806 RepID=UPI000382CF3B|nr:ParA family protein [Streptococcus ovis]